VKEKEESKSNWITAKLTFWGDKKASPGSNVSKRIFLTFTREIYFDFVLILCKIFGTLTDINVISSTSKSRITVTCCLWWKTWGGVDYGIHPPLLLIFSAILGSKEGSVTFVNFETQEDFIMIKLKFSITKMNLVVSPNKAFKVISVQLPLFDSIYFSTP
jgi:hypothetical protein